MARKFRENGLLSITGTSLLCKLGGDEFILGHILNISIWPNVFGYRPGIAKISLKNLELLVPVEKFTVRMPMVRL